MAVQRRNKSLFLQLENLGQIYKDVENESTNFNGCRETIFRNLALRSNLLAAHCVTKSMKSEKVCVLQFSFFSSAAKKVSWFRKEDGILHVLTIGKETFIADQRFSSAFKSPNDWRLRIKPTNPGDNGTYLCQISTHPPTLLVTHLQVIGKNLFKNFPD